jgi:hypothetical protein
MFIPDIDVMEIDDSSSSFDRLPDQDSNSQGVRSNNMPQCLSFEKEFVRIVEFSLQFRMCSWSSCSKSLFNPLTNHMFNAFST